MSRAIKVEACRNCGWCQKIPGDHISDEYWCKLAKKTIGYYASDLNDIAPFCPLPSWPNISEKEAEKIWRRSANQHDMFLIKDFIDWLKSINVEVKGVRDEQD